MTATLLSKVLAAPNIKVRRLSPAVLHSHLVWCSRRSRFACKAS